MRQLSLFLKKNKALWAALLLALLLESIGTLAIPMLTASMIDNGIMTSDMDAIISIGAKMLIISLVTVMISLSGSYLASEFAARFGLGLRNSLIRKTKDLSLADFEEFSTASLLTRTTTDVAVIQRTLMSVLQLVIPTPMMLLVSIVLIARTSATLMWIVLMFILIFFGISVIVFKKSSEISKYIQAGMDRINAVIKESVAGIRVIRAFNRSEYENNRCDGACRSYADRMISLNKLFAVLNPVVWLIMGLVEIAVIFFGGREILVGSMNVGDIVSVTEYAIMALAYMITAAMMVVTVPKMQVCLQRIQEVLDTRPSIADGEAKLPAVSQDKPSVVFDDVSFSYPGAEEKVLSHISFKCEAGKTTAFIGSTGSGKSTIAKLILRLYDIDSGRILVNGRDVRDYPQSELRDKIGYIPQKSFLFSGSIAGNLNIGKRDASKEDMLRAIKLAQADEFVQKLPQKLDAPSSQGGKNFSGGQRQRLAIARALIKEPDIYVFDDSFSALDYKTDALLRKTLKEEIKDSVFIIIAQRISTIMDADLIVVLDEGAIAGIGTHDKLMDTCSVYREIAQSQLDMEDDL